MLWRRESNPGVVQGSGLEWSAAVDLRLAHVVRTLPIIGLAVWPSSVLGDASCLVPYGLIVQIEADDSL